VQNGNRLAPQCYVMKWLTVSVLIFSVFAPTVFAQDQSEDSPVASFSSGCWTISSPFRSRAFLSIRTKQKRQMCLNLGPTIFANPYPAVWAVLGLVNQCVSVNRERSWLSAPQPIMIAKVRSTDAFCHARNFLAAHCTLH